VGVGQLRHKKQRKECVISFCLTLTSHQGTSDTGQGHIEQTGQEFLFLRDEGAMMGDIVLLFLMANARWILVVFMEGVAAMAASTVVLRIFFIVIIGRGAAISTLITLITFVVTLVMGGIIHIVRTPLLSQEVEIRKTMICDHKIKNTHVVLISIHGRVRGEGTTSNKASGGSKGHRLRNSHHKRPRLEGKKPHFYCFVIFLSCSCLLFTRKTGMFRRELIKDYELKLRPKSWESDGPAGVEGNGYRARQDWRVC